MGHDNRHSFLHMDIESGYQYHKVFISSHSQMRTMVLVYLKKQQYFPYMSQCSREIFQPHGSHLGYVDTID